MRSSTTARARHARNTGLVDEVAVYVVPVIVARGTRFFPEGVRLDLSLVEERRFDDGMVFLRYAVA